MSIRPGLAAVALCTSLACSHAVRSTSSGLEGTYEFSGPVADCGWVSGSFDVTSRGSVANFKVPTPNGFSMSGCTIRRLAIGAHEGSSVRTVHALVQVAESPTRDRPSAKTTFRRFPTTLNASRAE